MALIRLINYNTANAELRRHSALEDSFEIKSISFLEDALAPFTVLSSTLVANLNADKVDGKDVNDGDDSTASLWTAAQIKAFITNVLNSLDPQESVLERTDTPPVTPSEGDRYLVIATATGDFVGQEGKIAEYDGSDWVFITPNAGFYTYVEDEQKAYIFNGTGWVVYSSIVNHNALNTLQGGTSDQYYHLTEAQHTGLTNSGSTTLHKHNSDNLDEGTTNIFFTNKRAQDAVGLILIDTDSIDVTYNDVTPSISAQVRIDNTGEAINVTVGANGVKVTVLYDDVTVGLNASNQLEVKNDSIDINKLASNIDASSKGFNAATVGGKSVGTGDDDLLVKTEINSLISIATDDAGFQRAPVLDVVSDTPLSPTDGDRYLVVATATGDFVGQENKIATYDVDTWVFESPVAGWQVRVMNSTEYAQNDILYYNGSEWKISIIPEEDAYTLTDGRMSDASDLHTHLVPIMAGESIVDGEVIYIDETDGRAYKALGTTVSGKYRVLGVAATAGGIGDEIRYFVEQLNSIKCSSLTGGGWSSFTSTDKGKRVYLSATTAGAVSTTPPETDGSVIVKLAFLGIDLDSDVTAHFVSSLPIVL